MFTDRRDAGRRLAQKLRRYRGPNLMVLGLPRGGVPVAAEVADAFDAPLDVLLVRRLCVPGHEDVAMGAVGEHGVRVVNRRVVHLAAITPADLIAVERHEREAIRHQSTALRQGRRPLPLIGRSALIVDDGVATGATAEVACRIARMRGAVRVILAVPVAAPEALTRLSRIADDLVCLSAPRWFGSLSEAYQDFPQISDQQAGAAMERAARRSATRSAATSLTAALRGTV